MKPKVTVYIRNEQKAVPLTPDLRRVIRTAAAATLDYEGFGTDAEISVTLTDDEGIRTLNRSYRKIDRPTDVLSFPQYEAGEAGSAPCPVVLGDIVISAERASAQAEAFGHSLSREVAFLTVHSTLHLLGYDHETSAKEEADMFARQEAVLEKTGLVR